jgi:hypothetical protein
MLRASWVVWGAEVMPWQVGAEAGSPTVVQQPLGELLCHEVGSHSQPADEAGLNTVTGVQAG